MRSHKNAVWIPLLSVAKSDYSLIPPKGKLLFRKAFFDYNFILKSPEVVKMSGDTYTIKIKAPPQEELMCYLVGPNHKVAKGHYTFVKTGQIYTFSFTRPNDNIKYFGRVYRKYKKDGKNRKEIIVDFVVP